jgi:hypothetical protein
MNIQFKLSLESEYELYDYYGYPVIPQKLFSDIYYKHNVKTNSVAFVSRQDNKYLMLMVPIPKYLNRADLERVTYRNDFYFRCEFMSNIEGNHDKCFFMVKALDVDTIPYVDTSIWGIFNRQIQELKSKE